jgi:hypothetical protein
MLRRSLVALAVAAPIALAAASPAAASESTAPVAAPAADSGHCFIFRPTPEWLLVYVKCVLSEVQGDGGTAAARTTI